MPLEMAKSISLEMVKKLDEPRLERTCLRGFRPGPTQTEVYSRRRWLEA